MDKELIQHKRHTGPYDGPYPHGKPSETYPDSMVCGMYRYSNSNRPNIPIPEQDIESSWKIIEQIKKELGIHSWAQNK